MAGNVNRAYINDIENEDEEQDQTATKMTNDLPLSLDNKTSLEPDYDKRACSNDSEDKDEEDQTATKNTNDLPQSSDNNESDISNWSKDHSYFIKYEDLWRNFEKLLTFCFILIVFLVVICAGVLSRVTLHILIWHIKTPAVFGVGEDVNKENVTLVTETNNTISVQNLQIITDEKWIWALFIVMIAPYLTTVLSCLKTTCLKKTANLDYKSLIPILLIETGHTIGLSCMVFMVLSRFPASYASVVYLAMPTLLPIYELLGTTCKVKTVENKPKQYQNSRRICRAVTIVLGFLFQLTGIGFVCYFILMGKTNTRNTTLTIIFVISAVLVSIRYWENFVPASDDSKWLPYLKWMYQTRRTKMMLIVNFWKIILSFVTIIVIYSIEATNSTDGVKSIFNMATTLFKSVFDGYSLGRNDECKTYVPYVIAVINICSSYLCAKAAKTACVINCQRFCFSFPLILVPLLSTLALSGLNFKDCDLYFVTLKREPFKDVSYNSQMIIAAAAFYFSLILISFYVWRTNGYILGKGQRLFIKPYYCGIHTEVSLLLNRRQNDKEYDEILNKERERKTKYKDKTSKEDEQDISRIYACATMWHETETEMTQLLKSISKLDEHQHIVRTACSLDEKHTSDILNYELKAHVFFDDAFEVKKDSSNNPDVNGYVKTLIRVVKSVLGVGAPNLVRTPYGGQMIWKLKKSNNELVVHLKDKMEIRHRKRWSQVMYMKYFLSHRMRKDSKQVVNEAFNTFLLALDGDVDFEPEAVMHLLRRMKKNPMVGAACGRIHPIGAGPLVWYQKFEYAISHWLQKATEHVIGCVLCSPGCFSLFRGSAIMEVLETYTANPSEAQHYIQYDQGEDRWLCTLLLKTGYRVEYCAESDALTFAPEGFNEFYNQRRRWTPSTMANIMDLLTNWNSIINENQNISLLYMAYQFFLFVSSILTPGTIFLMIVGAIIVAFPSVPPWLALTLNVIPVGLFMLACIFTKSETQLLFAAVLSSIYSITMMIVLVGILKEAAEEGFCSITTIFLCFVAGVFVVSAILHPQEALCIIHGILYFISIPSMSMLLILYSLGNLHVVSWGTREVKEIASTQNSGKEDLSNAKESGYKLSFGNIFRCICCPSNGISKEGVMYRHMLDRMNDLESQIIKYGEGSQTKANTDIKDAEGQTSKEQDCNNISQQASIVNSKKSSNEEEYELEEQKRHCVNQTKANARVDFEQAKTLSAQEKKFWEKIIKTYLQPIEKDKAKEDKIQEDLISLRNKCCLFFFLINALLVTLIYALTQANAYNKSLSIDFTCEQQTVSIEPISITFTLVFGILLFIQFVCLLVHRVSTLIHITATTSVTNKLTQAENVLIVADILHRSGSIDSEVSTFIEDYQRKFEDTKRKRISKIIECGQSKKSEKRVTYDKIVEKNYKKLIGLRKQSKFKDTYGGTDELDGQINSSDRNLQRPMDSMDRSLQQFGHLTPREKQAMKNFIKKPKEKSSKIVYERDTSFPEVLNHST